MDIHDELADKLLKQLFADEQKREDEFRQTSARYARIENAIAVLSDMKTNSSHICYGGLAERLGIGRRGTSQDITGHITKSTISNVRAVAA